jgi:hypothetical protein
MAHKNAIKMARVMVITGMAVDTIPRPMPEMTTVAGPVFELSDTLWVGLYEWEVKYSVDCPMITPAAIPDTTENEIPSQW